MAANYTTTFELKAINAVGPGADAAKKALAGVGVAAKSAGKESASAMAGIAKGVLGVAAGFATMEVAKKALEVGIRAVGAAVKEAFNADSVKPFRKEVENVTLSWRNLLRGVGDIITQSPAVQTAMRGVDEILARVRATIEDNSESIQRFIQKGIGGLLGAVEGAIRGGGFLIKVWDGLRVVWQGLQLAVVTGALKVVEALHGLGAGAVGILNLFRDADNQLAVPFSSALESLRMLQIGARETLEDGLEDFQRHARAADVAADAVGRLRAAVASAKPTHVEFGTAVKESTAKVAEEKKAVEESTEAKTDETKATKESTEAKKQEAPAVAAAAFSWREYAGQLFDVGGIVSNVMTGIIDAIGQAVAFNKDASREMLADLNDSVRLQEISVDRAYESMAAAHQALLEARAKGDAEALEDAQQNFDEMKIAWRRAQREMTRVSREQNAVREDTEKTTGKRILESVGQVLLSIIQQVISAALTKVIVDGITASTAAISAHAGIPYVGIAIGLAAAATIAGIIGGFASKIPKAATGAIIGGGTPGRDSVLINAMPGEAILSVEATRALMESLSHRTGPTGTTRVSGGIPQAATGAIVAGGNNGGGATIMQTINIYVTETVKDARELARTIAPELRRLQHQGAF